MNQYYGTVIVKRKNPSDDELQHFKYIKREKKNGKWVYYYDKDQLKRDVSKKVDDVKDKLGFDERDAANKQHDKAMTVGALREVARDEYRKNVPMFGPGSEQQRVNMANAKSELKKWDDKFDEEAKKYYQKKKEFHKTPLGKLDKVAEKGKNLVENLLGRDIWQDFKKSKR